jgi:hypothetical protein
MENLPQFEITLETIKIMNNGHDQTRPEFKGAADRISTTGIKSPYL